MKKLIFTLLIASISGLSFAQTAKTTEAKDPLVGADMMNKGDKLVTKTWVPVSHKLNGKDQKIATGDFSRFLASGGYDSKVNGASAMGIWMYDAATNKLTIRTGETSTAWDLKEVTDNSFTITTATEEKKFTVKAAAK